MSTPTVPTPDQLAETRARLWHQSGDPILTVEGLRAWLNRAGLVLVAPRPHELAVPAPSILEAVVGAPGQTTSEDTITLTARLIAEGSAVPLNLLGTQGVLGGIPDFLCSAQVFSYIFTLRGDKAWKQPPATIGAVKVSPLALAAYELLTPAALTAAELATALGKEVTEPAVLRALNELWAHLRILPIPQPDDEILWELASTRFAKIIKAGSNAGVPSALSALISLYLGMAVVASEDDIETFLSPLAPRSRIRDVVHALMGARELDTIAVGGRNVLHVAGDLPAFTSDTSTVEGEHIEVEPIAPGTPEDGVTPSRITKFVSKPRKIGTGLVKSFTTRPATGRSAERERRPFQKKSGPPSLTKPWNEKRPARRDIAAEAGPDAPPARPTFRDKPAFARRDEGGTRPTFRRNAPPRYGENATGRPPRKTFSKSGTFGRKRDAAASEKSESRPKSDFTPRSFPGKGRPTFGDRPERPFAAKSDRPASSERRPGSYSPRPTGEDGKPFQSRKPFTPREPGSFPPRKPFSPGGDKPFAKRPFSRKPDADGGAEAPRKTFRKFDAPRFDKPRGPRPEGVPTDRTKKPFAKAGGPPKKSFGPKKTGPFAKFGDGKKPFHKSAPGGKPIFRKRKPEEGEA